MQRPLSKMHVARQARSLVLVLTIALISACQVQKPPPDEAKSYERAARDAQVQKPLLDDTAKFYGPVARNMLNLPKALKNAICANEGRDCLANPGERWESSDIRLTDYPTAQLIWARRAGTVYIVKTARGGSNTDIAFDFYQAEPGNEQGFHRTWRVTGYEYDQKRHHVPKDIDPRVWRIVTLVFNPPKPCLRAVSQPMEDCAGSERWPFS